MHIKIEDGTKQEQNHLEHWTRTSRSLSRPAEELKLIRLILIRKIQSSALMPEK
jgi:hypothetical protein